MGGVSSAKIFDGQRRGRIEHDALLSDPRHAQARPTPCEKGSGSREHFKDPRVQSLAISSACDGIVGRIEEEVERGSIRTRSSREELLLSEDLRRRIDQPNCPYAKVE